MQDVIRRASFRDLLEILDIYAFARSFMAQNGNPNQWGNTNPPRRQLEADIERGELYVVVRDGCIRGVFAFILGDDPTYGYIEGAWHSSLPYGTIHRVAGNGAGGIFSSVFRFCLGQIGHLRIDTHHDNRIMQHVIEKAGFRRCGVIYVEDGSPRIAYEYV